jgi:hypothetical protein
MIETRRIHSRSRVSAMQWLRVVGIFAILVSCVSSLLQITPTFASTISSASFNPNTVVPGASTTLTVITNNTTTCVQVTGAFSATQHQATPKTTWTFTTTAPNTTGLQQVTIKAGDVWNDNPVTPCNNTVAQSSASYTVVANTSKPVTTATLTDGSAIPTWSNTSPVTVKLTATTKNGDAKISQISYKLDSATSYTTVTGTGPTNVTVSSEGRHTLSFFSKDSAGATEDAKSTAVNIDLHGPTFDWAPTTSPNANNWYKSPVTVSAANVLDPTLADGTVGSGVLTSPTSVTVGQNGASGTFSPSGTATDNAGNSTTKSVATPIQIDQAAPTITGSAQNADGSAYSLGTWTNQSVTVSFSCGDTGGSGVNSSGCPSSHTFATDGNNLTWTGTVSDKAGNSSSATVGDATHGYIKIDKTAPMTSASPSPNNTWNNTAVTVNLTATDGSGSGVATTYYTVNGGNQQTYSSTNKPSFSTDGTYTLVFWSVDNAGNTESHTGTDAAAHTATINIDGTPPTISHSFEHPGDGTAFPANASGWHNDNVLVDFTCGDTGGSQVASCGPDATVSTEGKGQVVSGQAVDNAGNTSTIDQATVNLDKTSPTISAAATYPNGDAYTGAWTNQNITVRFVCTDPVPSGLTLADISGLATCSTDQTFITEGTGLGKSGQAVDNAGNTSTTAGVNNIRIDKTAPSLSGTPSGTLGDNGWYTSDVSVTWTCSDDASGINASASIPAAASGSTTGCPDTSTITGEGNNLSASASVTDNAGNPTTQTVSNIKIDRTAPVTSATLPPAYATGWYAGAVNVTLATSTDLSGVAATYYTINGGDPQTYNGTGFAVTAGGINTVVFWSKDNAGNVESYTGDAAATHTLTIEIDNLPPNITGSAITADGSPYTVGTWTNQDVLVSFSCSDSQTAIDSGLAGCSLPTTLSTEGDLQQVTGSALDVAGNSASATVGSTTDVAKAIRIDKTKPQLTYSLSDPSGKGPTGDNLSWNNSDVTVTWTALDALSGVDTSSLPTGYTKNADGSYSFTTTISGEGRNLGLPAGAVSVKDLAGNKTSSDAVSGVNIDRNGPTISKTVIGTQGTNGWFTGAVTVDFQCSDPALADSSNGSGVAACPTSKILSHDGASQSVTSDPASDYAGNSTAGITVGGINIDGTAPQTSANNTCTKVDNYCKGTSAIVNLTAIDATSGVSEVDYRVETGTGTTTCDTSATNATYPWQKASATNGQIVPVTVPLSGSGAAEVDYYAVDAAGNREAMNCANLAYDNIAPTITHTFSTQPNDAGWNNGNVTLTWNAKDDDSGSGVNATTWSVTPSTLNTSALTSIDGINWSATTGLSSETASTTVAASVQDKAANQGTDSQVVKIDTTKPTTTSSVNPSTPDGNNGWYVSPVKVSFSCNDPNGANGATGSGIAATACPDTVSLSGSGENQSVSRTVSDIAGNTSGPASVTGIKIDVEKPTISSVTVANGSYTVGGVPAATCIATDSFSGVQSCTVQVTAPANGVGSFSYVATATDKAGNTSMQTGSYTVAYGFSKFLQPINDTAHTGAKMSIFKAGSTIPVKFRLTDAAGNPIQASAAPIFVNLGKVGTMLAGANSTGTTTTADTGSTYRYDSSGGQYIFNWKSPNDTNAVYRIGAQLNDGTTYTVDIGLK